MITIANQKQSFFPSPKGWEIPLLVSLSVSLSVSISVSISVSLCLGGEKFDRHSIGAHGFGGDAVGGELGWSEAGEDSGDHHEHDGFHE